jgi:DNA-directed RNA polymerase subunit RPC12/RpoP
MTFIVEYRCPRCDAALEARSSQDYGWLRCPRCGRASLPPEHMHAPRPRARVPLGADVLIIGPERPGASATGRSSFRPGSFRRIAGATALFLSLLIALLSVLEEDRIGALVFTLIALACLAFSVYPARPRVA